MLNEKAVRVAIAAGVDGLFDYALPRELDGAELPGFRLKVPFNGRIIEGYAVDRPGESRGVLKPVHSLVEPFPVLRPGMLELARRVSSYYVSPPGEVLKAMLPGRYPLKREKPPPEPGTPAAPAEDAFLKVNFGRHGVFVLDSLPPEKEPETYLELARRCVTLGKGAVVLFPGRQALERFERVFSRAFPGICGVYHGGLPAGERRSAWEGAYSGRLKVVLGLRSAVFAPLPSAGLIIVHDEADFSYKSGRTPRFNGAAVALMRGRIEKCPVVLGGNFPSFETHRMVQAGNYERVAARTAGGKRPRVRMVDMRGERAMVFSAPLKSAVFRALDEKKQVLLYAGRRGYSNYFVCRECGFLKRCPNCSVCLRFHADRGGLVCHYCNYEEKAVEVCPACRRSYFRKAGFGAQKVESLALKIFRGARVARLDSDSAGSREEADRAIEDFRSGKTDILVDTGISLNAGKFENTAICGIMSADNLLNLPDFKAAENLFRFVSGACSAVTGGAEVVIQTYNPGHYVMDCLRTLDREGFYARESVIRKKLRYPPFGGICSIILSGRSEKKTRDSSRRLRGMLESRLGDDCEILGPVPAVIEKIRGMHRMQVVIKSRGPGAVSQRLRDVLAGAKRGKILSGVRLTVDVDPVNMM